MTLTLRKATIEDKEKAMMIDYDMWYAPDEEHQKTVDFWKAVASLDMNSFYIHSNYLLLAEWDSEVVGMVLAEIPKANLTYLYHYMSDGRLEANIISKADKELRESYQTLYTNEEAFHTEAGELVKASYDAAINIFAVNRSVQGKGVGRRLFEQALTDFQDLNAKNFYLYTDTECDYQFYDYIGMERISIFPEENLDNYVYGADIKDILSN